MTVSDDKPSIHVKVAGQDSGLTFSESFRLGRAPDNDFVVDDPVVSLHHAVVLRGDDGAWWFEDLGSANGTFVAGKRVQRYPLIDTVPVRLGFDGPALIFHPCGVGVHVRPTILSEPSESKIVERYLGDRAPTDMSEHTAMLRRVLQHEQRRRVKKYMVALAVLAVIAVGASAYVYVQRQQLKRARLAAADLFYAMKSLELEVARLQLTASERESYRVRRQELQGRYIDYLEELGLYSDRTPQDVQLIYRVIHRFGESEANVPADFVREVRRYVDRWKRTDRLQRAIARSDEHDYAPRIAEIMLQNDMPPEFFYLGLQESDLNLEAVGPATRFGYAKGMWQFLPSTARAYGLQTGPLVGVPRFDPGDDRHQFEDATQAAAEYLRDIYTTDAQASGLLVMASYNWGQTNVLRLIRTMPESPRERNFWQLLSRYRERIPQETYHYVFSIVSAAVIGENPSLFGFAFDGPLPPREAVSDSVNFAPRQEGP